MGRTRSWPSRADRAASSAIAWPYIAASLVLGFVLPHLQQGPFAWANPLLGKDQVIAFLSSVSSGMMAFTGIVFSLLFIMLQFGSSAYSPHLVPMLQRNQTLTHAGGVFTGTFLYTLMALRVVGTLPQGQTPALTIWVAFFWLIASVYLLIRLVGVFAGLAITEVLEMLGASGRAIIRQNYGPYAPEDSPSHDAPVGPITQTFTHAGSPLYLVGFDERRLVSLARQVDGVLHVLVSVGDPISTLTRVAVLERGRANVPEEQFWAALGLAHDRTEEKSPRQSLRMLVDIGLHALSATSNDPTSAVRAIDQIESLLVELGSARLESGRARDDAGKTRLVYPPLTWEECLELGATELQLYGEDVVQVERRLAAMYQHLYRVLPEARRPAIVRLDGFRRSAVEHAFAEASLRRMAASGDRQGLGHTIAEGAEG